MMSWIPRMVQGWALCGGEVLDDVMRDVFWGEFEVLIEFFCGSGESEIVESEEESLLADDSFPSLYGSGFDDEARMIPEDLFLCILTEEVEARNGDDVGVYIVCSEHFSGTDGKGDFCA